MKFLSFPGNYVAHILRTYVYKKQKLRITIDIGKVKFSLASNNLACPPSH